MIKAKDTWDSIVLVEPEAETSAGAASNRIVKGKAAKLKINRIIDAKARTVIIGYYRLEALSRILYLRTAKE